VEVAEPIDLPDGSEVTIASAANVFPHFSEGWSESKNERRGTLIRKKFAQGIDDAETRELAELQDELAAYRRRATPLPYDVLDEKALDRARSRRTR
jgi:hypothetical protein